MSRDYVTIREEMRGGETVWTFTTVGHARLKSAPAKVVRRGERYTVVGVAWGAPIARVEVRIDDGPWHAARLDRWRSAGTRSVHDAGVSWRFWTFEWPHPAPGEHMVSCRAIDQDGNVQPTPEAPIVASRRTYWENNGQITRRVRIP